MWLDAVEFDFRLADRSHSGLICFSIAPPLISSDSKNNGSLWKHQRGLQGLLLIKHLAMLKEWAGKDALGLHFCLLTPLSCNKLVLHDNTYTSACATNSQGWTCVVGGEGSLSITLCCGAGTGPVSGITLRRDVLLLVSTVPLHHLRGHFQLQTL